MKYSEAVKLLASDPSKTYIGIQISIPEREVTFITLNANEGEVPPHFLASYSSGRLFNSCGCEDSFELDAIPEDVLNTVHAMNFFECISAKFSHDMISEYGLCAALPELKCPEGDSLEPDDDSIDAFLNKAQEIIDSK